MPHPDAGIAMLCLHFRARVPGGNSRGSRAAPFFIRPSLTTAGLRLQGYKASACSNTLELWGCHTTFVLHATCPIFLCKVRSSSVVVSTTCCVLHLLLLRFICLFIAHRPTADLSPAHLSCRCTPRPRAVSHWMNISDIRDSLLAAASTAVEQYGVRQFPDPSRSRLQDYQRPSP